MSEEAKWYVAHTYSGYEEKVKTDLEKTVKNRNLQDMILEVKYPTEEVVEIREDGKRKVTKRKTYPGYVMVKMFLTDESWYVVRNTTGVTGFVGMGNKPVALKDYEVTELLRQAGMEDPKAVINYNVGDKVEVLDGSFAGMMGNVTSIDAEKGKVIVSMTLFGGRETPVDLEYHQVRKI